MKNEQKKKITEASAIPPPLSPRVSFVAYAWCLLGPCPSPPPLPPFLPFRFFLKSFSPFSRGVKLALRLIAKHFVYVIYCK